MAKILLKTCLKTRDETIVEENLGLLFSDKITYLEKGVQVSLSWSQKQLILKRKGIDYEIVFCFEEKQLTEAIYKVFDVGIIPLSITTQQLIIKPYFITMKYTIDKVDSYEFEMTYEVIE